MNSKKELVAKDEKLKEDSHKEVELAMEEHGESKGLWDVIKLPWYEYLIVAMMLGAAITMFVLNGVLGESKGMVIGLVVSASVLGLWLAFRPSEWAVDGLDNVMRYVGLTAFVAGVISSLASNLPEAVTAGILLIKGTVTDNHSLVLTAFYTTLAAAGFNAILLGIVILVGGKKKGYIQIKKETVMAEGVLLRWGFVAMLLTFSIAVIEILDVIFLEVKNETFFAGIDEIEGELPRLAGMALVVSYIIYLVFLIIKSRQAKAMEEMPEETIRATKPTRGKLDEKMPDIVEEDLRKQPVESAQRKILDTPEEINIIDSEREEPHLAYTGSEKVPTNPYLTAPHMEHPHLSLKASIVLVILGVVGIGGGGYLLSHAVETMMESEALGFHVDIGLLALIVGFAGAIPEHGIAVVAAAKGKTDIALGNILGGMLQMTLLVFGAFASIVKAPITDFMMFQMIALAGIIWFVKRSISDDHRLTFFEGIMIILAQLFSFLLLIGELTGLNIF